MVRFKGEEWDAVTVDGTHPNDFGFYRFSKYLEKFLKENIKEYRNDNLEK